LRGQAGSVRNRLSPPAHRPAGRSEQANSSPRATRESGWPPEPSAAPTPRTDSVPASTEALLPRCFVHAQARLRDLERELPDLLLNRLILANRLQQRGLRCAGLGPQGLDLGTHRSQARAQCPRL